MTIQRAVMITVICGSLTSCAFTQATRHYGAGTDALARHDYATAITELEKAKELNPKWSNIRNNLGTAYAKVGRDDEAWFEYRQAVLFSDRNQYAVMNFARYWSKFKAAGALDEGKTMAQVKAKLGMPDLEAQPENKEDSIWIYGLNAVQFRAGKIAELKETVK
jgi:tetratricopeptide (TPR) repeat protein